MQFGVQFFPIVGPDEKSARDYFRESLAIAEEADQLGYTHVRTVEHYFESYGGYSPNPIVFLTAASQRTKRARLVTGAVLPAFNNPLKLAGELGMLDAISGGRLDVGFARAFLPYEFRHFGVSMDESVARYEEGIEHGDLAGELERIVERRHHRAGDQTHLFGALRRGGEKQHRVRAIAAVAFEIMLDRTGMRIAEFVGFLGDIEALRKIIRR